MNFEEAKNALKKYRYSKFSMARENQPLYEDYLNLNISESIENKWYLEALKKNSDLLYEAEESEKWLIVDTMSTLVEKLKTDESFEVFISAIDRHSKLFDDKTRVIVSNIILGKKRVSVRSGLIFLASDLNKDAYSEQLMEITQELLQISCSDRKLEKRRSDLKKNLEDINHEILKSL